MRIEDMTNGNSAEMEARFDSLIDVYQATQHGGTLSSRADARFALKQAFRDALSVCADGGKGEAVAIVESWTNGSYHRNYNLRWLKDVPKGAALYTAPQAECAPRAQEYWTKEQVAAVREDAKRLHAKLTPGKLLVDERADAEKDAALTDAQILELLSQVADENMLENHADEVIAAGRAILAARDGKNVYSDGSRVPEKTIPPIFYNGDTKRDPELREICNKQAIDGMSVAAPTPERAQESAGVPSDELIEQLAVQYIAPHAGKIGMRVPYQQTEQFKRVKDYTLAIFAANKEQQ